MTSSTAPTTMQVPESSILRNVLHRSAPSKTIARVRVIDAQATPGPVWQEDEFFLANVGTDEEPLFLELRFEEASPGVWIALLMTNERQPRDLSALSARIIAETNKRGIEFGAVIGVESLGAKLSQEIARQCGEYTLTTTLQKGKPRMVHGSLVVGAPKEWVREQDSVAVSSGTSTFATQALFLDHKIAAALGDTPVMVVDDSRLTSGTVHASIELARKMGLNLSVVATVMNEADPTDVVEGVPYVSLVKIPVFHKDSEGLRPTEGTYDGVPCFYQEVLD